MSDHPEYPDPSQADPLPDPQIHLNTMLAAAIRYIDAGLAVTPIARGQKRPMITGWQKAPFPSKQQVIEWFGVEHPPNIGIRTGKASHVFVLDVDVAKGSTGGGIADGACEERASGEHTLSVLERHFGDLPPTVRVETPSGGFHLYFRLPEGVTIRNSASRKLGDGLDIRGDNGQVVAPPSRTGKGEYTADGDEGPELKDKIADAPQWLLDKIISTYKPKTELPKHTGKIIHAEGGRNMALTSLAGAMRRQGVAEETLIKALLAENEAHCVPPLESEEVIKIAVNIFKYEPEPAYENIWREGLAADKEGRLKASSGNVTLILLYDDRTSRRLRWNNLEYRIESTESLPFKKRPGPLDENDIVGMKQWLGNKQMLGQEMSEPSIDTAYHGIIRAARTAEFDPIADYLTSLTWDGIDRVDTMLSDFCETPQNEYTQAVAHVLIYGAVLRALIPGCKLDYMPISVGEQGCRKTTMLIVLYSPWYREMTGAALGTAAAHEIQGAWVLEIAELQQYGRSAEDQAKAFITRQIDVYRPPYAREYVSRPRRCLIVGTTNDYEFLRDPTGNRRYLPFRVGQIDTEGLAEVKDQLFAEAMVKAVEQDENGIWKPRLSLVLSPEAARAAIEVQQDSMVEDPWESMIIDFIRDRDHIHPNDVLEMLSVPVERRDRRALLRVVSVLRQLGYERKNVNLPYPLGRTKRYVKVR